MSYKIKLPTKETINLCANHLLVIMAFFLPINSSFLSTIFFILSILFILRGNYLFYFKEFIANKVILSIIIYILLNILWIFISSDIEYSINYVRYLNFYLYPILYFSFLNKQFIYRIFSSFLLGVFFSEVLSYSIFFKLITPPIPFGRLQTTVLDPTPFFHHMEYGFLLTFASILLLQRFLIENFNIKKFIYLIFFITITTNIFINAGRTGYTLFILSVFIFLVLHFKKRLLLIAVSAIFTISMIIFLAYTFSPNFKIRSNLTVQSIENIIIKKELNSSIGARVNMVIFSLALIKDRPFIGYGSGMAIIETRRLAENQKNPILNLLNNIPRIDNQYIESLLQFGIIGLIMFFNILFSFARSQHSNQNIITIKYILIILVLLYSLEGGIMGTGPLPKILLILIVLLIKPIRKIEYKISLVNGSIFIKYLIASIILFTISKLT